MAIILSSLPDPYKLSY